VSSYTSKEFLELEKVRVFERAWTCVGVTSQVPNPGDVVVLEVGTQPIIIVRNKKGEVNVFKNVCRHRGNKLCHENGNNPVLLCKYHRWGYSLDGRLVATPLFSQQDSQAIKESFDTTHVKNFNKSDYNLFPVRHEVLGNLIFVNIDQKAPPLREYLGDAVPQIEEHLATLSGPDLVSVRTKVYNTSANWKLLAENFMEYYHLPSVHPSLVTVSGMDEHKRTQGKGCYVGFVTDPLTPSNTPADPYVIPHFPTLTGSNNTKAVWHHLFPNIFYFMLPHSMYTVISFPDPEDPRKTVEFADLSVHKSALAAPGAEEKIEAMWKFYDMTNLEDIDICENVQRGLGVYEYNGGRLSFRFEETIHRFQNMVADFMTNRPEIPEGDATMAPGAARARQ
jgi:choline monooxygenase